MAFSMAKMKCVVKQKHFPFVAILRISRLMYFNWISGNPTAQTKQLLHPQNSTAKRKRYF